MADTHDPAPDLEAVDNKPAAPGGRPYHPPRLRPLGAADELLEVLGPAQANYGGVMTYGGH